MDRKKHKKAAKLVLKKHYIILAGTCLFAAVLGSQYSLSLTLLKDSSSHLSLKEIRPDMFGTTRGVLAGMVNQITSGNILIRISDALTSIFKSSEAVDIVMIIGGFFVIFVFWALVQNVFKVILRRIFLEGRIYGKLHAERFAYLYDARMWIQASKTMVLFSLLKALWLLTIVGGVIKHYSYYMVPFITAENPSIKPLDAINLSRKMMLGHKMECFKYEMSFLGWKALGIVTAGISDILFANPYISATMSEYYVWMRQEARKAKVEGVELLNDPYLFRRAPKERLELAYMDIKDAEKETYTLPKLSGIRKFFANVLGIALWEDAYEEAYRKKQENLIKIQKYEDAMDGKSYPVRLAPLYRVDPKIPMLSTHYVRHYSLWSLILIFFSLSLVGWLWEVSLHLINNGEFVNRGVLHGPWLPIYGGGSILILCVLNLLRKKPAYEFCSTIVLCGFVEYMTAWILETLSGGMKWWDYTGYFLNLNGRICAEGLLVFGIGGMAMVYFLAPRLDNLFSEMNPRIKKTICTILMLLFIADAILSTIYPNTGEGITSI